MKQASETRVFDVPLEEMAELATSVVNHLGWTIKFINPKRCRLSAYENKTDHDSGVTWRFEFTCIVTWEKVASQVEVSTEVKERRMEWTEDQCRSRCKEILDAIAKDARDLHSGYEEPDTHGSARWAKDNELLSHGYLTKTSEARRFLLGPASNGGGYICVPEAETYMHAIVCGPTGSGKSSTIYIPNLIERTGVSAIVTEATAGDEPPDLFQKTSGFRKMAGHQIYKFNPDDLTSHRINPIEHVKTYDQASLIANLLIENTSSRHSYGDKIWENSEKQLLTTLIVHATSENADLGAIRRWLRQGPDKLGVILMNSTMQEAKDEYWGFYKNSSEGFRNGVLSGLMQRLNLWVNPRIVALTEKTDIDLKALPEQLFTFYFAVPAQKTQLKPLAALIFNFVLDVALSSKFKYPFALYLDEFSNYGYIPGIAEKLTIIRHRKIPATLGFQDFVQLRKIYGEEDATLLFGQPATKVFFRPRDFPTAKKISDMLGHKTVPERKVTSSGHIQEREFQRPLMNASEVMALKPGNAIAFTPSTNPLELKTFSWQQYVEPTNYEPPEFRTLEVSEELMRICNEAKTAPEWQKDKQTEKVKQKEMPKERNGRKSAAAKKDPKMERSRVTEASSDNARKRREEKDRSKVQSAEQSTEEIGKKEKTRPKDRDSLPDI